MGLSFSKDRFGASQSAPMAGLSIPVISLYAQEESITVRLARDWKARRA